MHNEIRFNNSAPCPSEQFWISTFKSWSNSSQPYCSIQLWRFRRNRADSITTNETFLVLLIPFSTTNYSSIIIRLPLLNVCNIQDVLIWKCGIYFIRLIFSFASQKEYLITKVYLIIWNVHNIVMTWSWLNSGWIHRSTVICHNFVINYATSLSMNSRVVKSPPQSFRGFDPGVGQGFS